LFAEKLGFADFNRDMRNRVLACTLFDWSQISPAIFGSLFQGIMESRQRRQAGAHYTSERDILKVVRALFLDDLRAEFERIKTNKRQLKLFHQKLSRLRFLDPACGCGNFLVIAYRELRLLEIEVLKALDGTIQRRLSIQTLSLVDVDAFYGMEINEWPARIAEVAMWLMDHQMNLKVSEEFGQYFVRLPLVKSPTIVCGNALRLDWKEILPPDECSYVLGNPPFVGKQFATAQQKEDMRLICGKIKGAGVLDYVAAWYFKAARYIQGTDIGVGFVSTNSISQGEQVGVLWGELFARYRITIRFAHRTFPWASEARGRAHVHVIIIGFGANVAANNKRIYDYDADQDAVTVRSVSNISPYLIEGGNVVAASRNVSICGAPEMSFGNMPNDGGNLLMTNEEKATLLAKEPGAAKFIQPFLGAQEFINGWKRWCLWLKNASPAEYRGLPEVMKRIAAVKKHRRESRRETTRELARSPALFGESRQPSFRYLAIPKTSSEGRPYIPMGFLDADVIASTELFTIENASTYHFGILSSAMHMAWVRQVCGRLKSDFRYSNKLVYNNYPWPESPSDNQRAAVEKAAGAVLDEREKHLKKGTTLADLYDPLAMPPGLLKAHAALDRAVDRCYRAQPFTSDRQRVEFLFGLYEKLTAPLLPESGKKSHRQRQ
jgi:hypothetical protein